jgi:hypothetical protein
MPLSAAQTEALVTAMLTVNGYPVGRAAALMPKFREHSLLNPAELAKLKGERIISAMKEAGYERGGFLPILSFRLCELMEALASTVLDPLASHAANGDEAGFCALLSSIHGFGPRTSEIAWVLWTTPAKEAAET